MNPVLRLLLFLCVVLGVAQTAAAADLKTAASTVAKDLIAHLTKKRGRTPELLMLAEFKAPKGDAIKAQWMSALSRAIINERGVPLVDRASLQAALNEASLSQNPSDDIIGEMAGAFGAEVLIVGSIDRAGPDLVVNARAVHVGNGSVITATRATIGSDDGKLSSEAKTLETELRRLADKLSYGLERMEGDLRYQRIAVMPLEEVGSTTRDKQLGLLVSAELTTLLRRDHDLMVVERAQLKAIVEEAALGQMGVVDESSAVQIGKLAGAQGLVIGSVSEAGDRYLVNVRVVESESGRVVSAQQVKLPAADLVSLSSEAVVLRTRTGAVYRSILLPGWGQLYNREAIKGGIFVGLEITALGGALGYELWARKADRRYSKMQSGDFSKIADNRDGRRTWRNRLLFGALAIHLVNLLDAFLSGKSFDTAEIGVSGGTVGLRLHY